VTRPGPPVSAGDDPQPRFDGLGLRERFPARDRVRKFGSVEHRSQTRERHVGILISLQQYLETGKGAPHPDIDSRA